MTCLAAWAAMRPKSFGVSSHSLHDVAVLVEFLAVDADLAGVRVDRDEGLLGGVRLALVRRDERVGERLEERLDGDALVARDLLQRVEELEVRRAHDAWLPVVVAVLAVRASAGEGGAPVKDRVGAVDRRIRDPVLGAVVVDDVDRVLVGGAQRALERAGRRACPRRSGPRRACPAPGEVRLPAQPTLDAGTRDLELVTAGGREVGPLVEQRRDEAGHLGEVVEVEAAVALDGHPQDAAGRSRRRRARDRQDSTTATRARSSSSAASAADRSSPPRPLSLSPSSPLSSSIPTDHRTTPKNKNVGAEPTFRPTFRSTNRSAKYSNRTVAGTRPIAAPIGRR